MLFRGIFFICLAAFGEKWLEVFVTGIEIRAGKSIPV